MEYVEEEHAMEEADLAENGEKEDDVVMEEMAEDFVESQEIFHSDDEGRVGEQDVLEEAEISYAEEEPSYEDDHEDQNDDHSPQDVTDEEFHQEVVNEVVDGDAAGYCEEDGESIDQEDISQEEIPSHEEEIPTHLEEVPTHEEEVPTHDEDAPVHEEELFTEQGVVEEHQEVDGVQEDVGEQQYGEDSASLAEESPEEEQGISYNDASLEGDNDHVPVEDVQDAHEEVHDAAAVEEEEERDAGVSEEVEDNSEQRQDSEAIAKDDNEEEDFDNVVEVEEQKAESDGEDENIAQHISDSDEEGEHKTEEIKLGDLSEDDLRGASGSENEASGAEDTNISPAKKKAAVLSSDEEDEAEKEKLAKEKEEAVMKMFDSDSEDEQKEGVGELIADIFGESDDEGEEFTGFGQEEIGKKISEKAKKAAISDDSDDDVELAPDDQESEDEAAKAQKPSKKGQRAQDAGSDSDEGVKDGGTQGMSDFDIMLAKKKEENRKHRKRRDNSTFISDADDIINAMLTKMKEAAESDREANLNRKPALKKLKMLPSIISHLKKQNLKELFVDNGVIAAIADWLSLLPDRSLPHITIRTELLKVLHDLPSVGPETLKHSGIGKAVMILFKHPKEARYNRDSAGRLINKWSRPIFGLNENFKSMSREEREQRDLEQMPQAKRRKLTSGQHGADAEEGHPEHELGQLRPGEAGFVMRARVPMPSTKDYVVRPKWNVDGHEKDDDEEDQPARVVARRRSAGAPRSSKKDERLEKHMRNFAEKKKSSKLQRAVKISIEGNKMSIL